MPSNYLKSYYKTENPVVNRLILTRRILARFLAFIICSIFYFIIIGTGRFEAVNSTSSDAVASYLFFGLEILMKICCGISIVGVFLIALALIIPKSFNNFMLKIKYKFKLAIFNVLDWLVIVPICACIAIFTYSYIFVLKPISGDSMMPNFEEGERVLLTYDVDNIDRGTVVVVKVNSQWSCNFYGEEKQFIKRIVGLPGDRLTWIKGNLTINGELVKEEYIDEKYLKGLNEKWYGADFDGMFEYKAKDSNGNIIEYTKETNTDVIPEGYVFVLGDNRCNSTDSREIGLVPIKNIVGIVKMRLNGIIPKEIVKKGEIK